MSRVFAIATAVTATKNDILTALNKPDHFILPIVDVNGEEPSQPLYLRGSFHREPGFFWKALSPTASRNLGKRYPGLH